MRSFRRIPASIYLHFGILSGASSEFYGIALAGTAVTVGASVKWVGAVFAKSAITMGNAVEMTDGNGVISFDFDS